MMATRSDCSSSGFQVLPYRKNVRVSTNLLAQGVDEGPPGNLKKKEDPRTPELGSPFALNTRIRNELT